MRAREQILLSIKSAKPSYVPLQTFSLDSTRGDVTSEFKAALVALHTQVIEIPAREEAYAHLTPYMQAGVVYDAVMDPHKEISFDLSLALVEGRLGVAENGAIWVDTTCFAHHNAAAIFSCEHLALFLKKDHIVSTMHEAYCHLPMTGFGYGAFIAGPSKTADIEQSLVIGAHGPKALTVFLY